jgi:hypothetical protein
VRISFFDVGVGRSQRKSLWSSTVLLRRGFLLNDLGTLSLLYHTASTAFISAPMSTISPVT